MKATIKKVTKINGDNFFNIYANGKYVQCLYFLPNSDADSIVNEQKVYDEALAIAKHIESIESLEQLGEITVYETPTIEEPQSINTEAVNQ